MTNQQGAPEALRRAQYLTVVYRDIKPGDEARELIMHPKMTASSWSHVMNERDRLAALVEAQQPAPSAAEAKPECYRWERYDKWVNGWGWGDCESEYDPRLPENRQYHSENFNDPEEVRNFRALYRTAPQPSPTPQADSQPAADLDIAVMQLAESVGLIGPASRVHDLHAAIQRFHDLICVNATIKAAVMAADAIRGAATSARDYPPLPMQFACSGVFPVYSADQMRAYVDADRAARAPADSVTAPAGGAMDGWKLAPEEPTLHMGWAYLDAARESEPLRTHTFNHAGYRAMLAAAPTQPAQAADSAREDAARLERERICAAIKAEDDYCVDHGDYMLDSDDCIKIVRGEWVRPDFSVDAARKQGGA